MPIVGLYAEIDSSTSDSTVEVKLGDYPDQNKAEKAAKKYMKEGVVVTEATNKHGNRMEVAIPPNEIVRIWYEPAGAVTVPIAPWPPL